ncbi:Rrf2 family transcriptional regulator [Hyphococcus flavus]|uniref:Rrf2 family transcriptional regulator n=1 Tax=Hyphococcus flavus TaxID=1866326 RepID=A0AAF0CFZ1_9PROT|nr:Rrf2 family transcriptional regulator [Hyphococcus flavus]WDI32936.1 Rrf2 family transcriptional regulator [Hyphococcus flavus]
MAGSTRFAVAAHILALLAASRPVPVTSETLAASANTNPAVIRRLLGALSKAGLTSSQLGKGGGATLARGPKKITLREIHQAVEEPGLISLHRAAPNPDCPVGAGVQQVLSGVADEAEAAFLGRLEGVTLKQFAREIAAQNAAAKSAA